MEHVVGARIHQLRTIDPGEIRLVQLALPEEMEIAGKRYTIRDTMRPGTAFLAKPWGDRTGKYRRRMYTRSNTSFNQPRLLETFINHTHRDQSDTSSWWQSAMAIDWFEKEKTVEVRLQLDEEAGDAWVYENTKVCKSTNLRLEDNGIWEGMRIVCVAFGTGITPFLSYARYFKANNFGRKGAKAGAHLTLVASVRHEGQLMLHEELVALEQQFPQHFRYQPVLTRSWPTAWGYLKGRILHVVNYGSGNEQIDISPFQTIVPDIAQAHLRICGNVTACRQLTLGLERNGLVPLTVRAESW
ncbi:MAG: hypothetical protein MRJ67_06560 [Nitrospirales bacterium]|nr:hypothetical protein [Nitrospira sp.]MDR4460166.1 hypothetical protein [Nitrospirales bacterium]MDR4482911.1 hypothetical protein [Nitrospirales bacterium]